MRRWRADDDGTAREIKAVALTSLFETCSWRFGVDTSPMSIGIDPLKGPLVLVSDSQAFWGSSRLTTKPPFQSTCSIGPGPKTTAIKDDYHRAVHAITEM